MKDGGIEQTNFDTYTPMRMEPMPELDISIIGNREPAVGCGNPRSRSSRRRSAMPSSTRWERAALVNHR